LRASFAEQRSLRKRHNGGEPPRAKICYARSERRSSEDVMKTAILAVALATLACLPATAQPSMPPSGGAHACLRSDDIRDWKAIDSKTLVVEDSFHNTYQVALAAACEGLQFKDRVAFRPAAPIHLTCMGPGDDVAIRQLGTTSFARCPIATITPLRRTQTGTPQ
jgi:Family of unknown function (DUF6491)